VNSVDKLESLREILWCDHAGVMIQSATTGSTHVALLGKRAVHIVVEQQKVKILCHSCFVDAMQERLSLVMPV